MCKVMIDMCQTDFVDVFKKGHAHIFFEEPTEVFPGKTELVSAVLKRNGVMEMLLYISNDCPETVVGGKR